MVLLLIKLIGVEVKVSIGKDKMVGTFMEKVSFVVMYVFANDFLIIL